MEQRSAPATNFVDGVLGQFAGFVGKPTIGIVDEGVSLMHPAG